MERLLVIVLITVLLSCYNESEIETSFKDELSSNINNDIGLVCNLLKLNEESLYTGGGKTNKGDIKTNGIRIKKISNTDIEYNFSLLIDWRKEYDSKGKATLLSTIDSLATKNELKEPCYKFKDLLNDRIIYITKSKFLNQTKSKVFDLKENRLSELMYNKW